MLVTIPVILNDNTQQYAQGRKLVREHQLENHQLLQPQHLRHHKKIIYLN